MLVHKHSEGQVTAEETAPYMKRNPESPTDEHCNEQTVTNAALLMTDDHRPQGQTAAPTDMCK